MEAPNKTASKKTSPRRQGATAEEMSDQQREISVSEFFAKNRHLLGFDNPRKALLTAVKEAVDNALDACEEACILPDIHIELLQRSETRFKVTVRDNGPGIVRKQIENIFGRLLYGSKFHRLKMSRGQQGIGISAAGMYGLMTTGQPVLIISKTHKKKPAVEVLLKMDTSKNRADVVSETEHPEDDGLFQDGHGTQVSIELEGRYQTGRQSVDEYLDQTAIANPHARFTFVTPTNETIEFNRGTNELPPEAKEILPHPRGIELGTLIQMIERTDRSQIGSFLQEEFSRVSSAVAKEICERAGITNRTWVKAIGHKEAEAIYKAIQEVRITAPQTDCLVPIGTKALLSGLLKEVKAEFFTACTRPADVYRGNPFLIEVGLAFGGELPKDELIRVIRFANRVPLLYQQAACASFKAVLETSWKNYGVSQSRGSLPDGPIVVMVHMASVWVPFTSESKEAIADYDEIRKEMKLALQEVGRKLGMYVRRRQRMRNEGERRSIFERYIGEISQATEAITGTPAQRIYDALLRVAQRKTEEADAVLNDEGKRVKDSDPFRKDESVVILAARTPAAPIEDSASDTEEVTQSPSAGTLFGEDESLSKASKGRKKK
ncbi:MAG: DNA topoisomerase VI subunit B [Phycisphaerales bacterium]|nr:DNA topoisomerase VI subunit B [Phycisphaerales bacterium]